MARRPAASGNRRERRLAFGLLPIVGAGLVLATLLIYGQVRHHPFINFDDAQYVVENPLVAGGFTAEGAGRAFREPHAGNWHPLTWLSHMADVALFGMDAGRHHVMSAAIHAVNAVLLLFVLYGMTDRLWPSAFVAAAFAVHPTHVESVAWVAERKDVLSAFFWLLTLGAYARYARRPGPGRYALVVGAFAAGLLSKPMVVTLPLVLLVLDVWPLRRVGGVPARRLVVEKVPLLALAVFASLVTYAVQQQAGAVKDLAALPPVRRAVAVFLGYGEYVVKTLWPADLALLYPHATQVPWTLVALAVVGLGGVTLLASRMLSRAPYLAAGWAWFLITLLPVIGIVQVGGQRIADRYTYIPTIGLFVMIAWGGADLARRWRVPPRAVAAASGAVLIFAGAVAHAQTSHWAGSISIWSHTLAATGPNARAHNHLGHALAAAGRHDEARREYKTALRLHPDYPQALNNLGTLLAGQGEVGPAIAAFERAIALAPSLPHARANLALALTQAGRPAEAVPHFARLAATEPSSAEAHRRLGVALALAGRYGEAIAAYEAALARDPSDAVTRNALGAALGAAGREAEAAVQYAEAVRLAPDLLEARANLGRTLLGLGRRDDGTRELYDLAVRHLRRGELEPALQSLEVLLRHDPAHAPSRQLLAELADRGSGIRD